MALLQIALSVLLIDVGQQRAGTPCLLVLALRLEHLLSKWVSGRNLDQKFDTPREMS